MKRDNPEKIVNVLVFSAHAADYVWRAGGTIAKYSSTGRKVHIVCLSYGEKGESDTLWQDNQTLEEVKKIRHRESSNAARELGASIEFLDWGDYPLYVDEKRMENLVKIIRERRPEIIITHQKLDPFNLDHEETSRVVVAAAILASAIGVMRESDAVPRPRIFGYEHHNSDLSKFLPTAIVDVTDSFDAKVRAMNCFETQKSLIEFYTTRARSRASQAQRISQGAKCKYAEAFEGFYPDIKGEL